MDRRIGLHQALVGILGSANVYFDPPETVRLSYPAIIYTRKRIRTNKANDELYNARVAYDVILIDRDPDNTIVGDLLRLQMSSYDRHYVADNLHHDVLTIYY